jgi:hypothetical protein
MVVRICIIRHSKSGSNLLKEQGLNGQGLRDPGLTVLGSKAAHEYSPKIQKILEDNGFDLSNTMIGASPLRRAQETAHALFPDKSIRIFGQLNEHGDIPENIPRCSISTRKGWNYFLKWLENQKSPDEDLFVVAVGHRTFFRREVLKTLGKRAPMNNMDAAIVEYDGKNTTFVKYIPHGKSIPVRGDKYIPNRTYKSTKKTNGRTRKTQHGGSLPYAYFQDGAQMDGRTDMPTGDVIQSGDSWIRGPIVQSGGACKCQRGGFPPAIMGSFVENGLSLLPAAGYMLYRASKKTSGRSRARGARKTRRIHKKN